MIILALSLCATASAQESFVSRIDVQKGEHWWGIYVGNSPDQPLTVHLNAHCSEIPKGVWFERPLLMSGNGRIIRSEHPMDVEFNGRTFTITSAHEKVQAESVGRTLRDAYLVACHRYFPPSGEAVKPDLYSSVVYSTRQALGHAQGQQEILDYARALLDEGFPVGTIVIPDGWRSLNGGLMLDPVLYPDPAAMTAQLHEMGFKVMLTVTPYAPAAGKSYATALRKGWLLRGDRTTDENPDIPELSKQQMHIARAPIYDTSIFAEGAFYEGVAVNAIYDVSIAEVAAAFGESLAALPFTPDFYLFDAAEVRRQMRNDDDHGQAFMTAWARLAQDAGADVYMGAPCALATSAACDIMGFQYPGDDFYVEEQINNITTSGLLGVRYATATFDFGYRYNGENQFSAAGRTVLSMGMPVAVMNYPLSQLQGEEKEQVKRMAAYRSRMAAYMIELVNASARSGEPLVRNMEYQFPKSGFADCLDQFMLGPKYMFAPSEGEQTKRMVRIPKGNWTDGNGRKFKGPKVVEINSSDPLAGCFEHTDK